MAGSLAARALVRLVADHAHRQPAVVAEVVDDPGLAVGAHEDVGAEHVRDHQVVVTAEPGGRQRVERLLVGQQRDRDERRRGLVPFALGDRGQDGGLVVLALSFQLGGPLVLAEVVKDDGHVPQAAPAAADWN